MGSDDHKRAAEGAVRCAVLTISDTRTTENDLGGALLCRRLEEAGHEVVDRSIVRDDPEGVRAHVRTLAARGEARIVVTTGGTGITARDSTYEALRGLFEKELPGFGELFRALSYQAIGASAMLSRATAGTFGGLVIIALPGAPEAVRLALEKLILPELAHLAWLVSPARPGAEGGHPHPHHHAHHAAASPPSPSEPKPPVDTKAGSSSAAAESPTLVRDVHGATHFAAAKMQKVGLFSTAQMFCDVYGLQPGQAQSAHLHDGADKIYYVLEGEGRFTLGEREVRAKAGCAIHAPAGVVHGVANDGPARLAVLVFMAPNPTPPGGK